MSRRAFWILFVVVQTVGLVCGKYANVHTRPFHLLAANLLPGSVLAEVLKLNGSTMMFVGVCMTINLLFWAVLSLIVVKSVDAGE